MDIYGPIFFLEEVWLKANESTVLGLRCIKIPHGKFSKSQLGATGDRSSPAPEHGDSRFELADLLVGAVIGRQ